MPEKRPSFLSISTEMAPHAERHCAPPETRWCIRGPSKHEADDFFALGLRSYNISERETLHAEILSVQWRWTCSEMS